MTEPGRAKKAASALLNGLLGACIGAFLGVVDAYVVPHRWLRNDPHRWWMIVLLAVVCCIAGVRYTFRRAEGDG